MQKQLDTVYDWFEHAGRAIVGFRWIVILCLLLITGLAIPGLPKITTEGFLLEGAEIKKAQNAFEELFGNNDYAAFLIEAGDVFSPRILAMLRRLGDELMKSNLPTKSYPSPIWKSAGLRGMRLLLRT